MTTLTLFIAIFAVGLLAAFYRSSLRSWTIVTAVTLVLFTVFSQASLGGLITAWVLFALIAAPLNHQPTRRQYITRPVLEIYRKLAPKLSDTEAIALKAGTVGWEGELFSGKPDFKRLLGQPVPRLSAEERAFLDGPVEKICALIDEWEITHKLADLSPAVWDYIKQERFFGMIIPKEYGGLGFSALAHSRVLQKIASKSITVASTIAVPNSLGPAELLLHYGTDEQKNYYLPRLAKGEEIPCFGLTGPTAGSDATSIPDLGIICKRKFKGKLVLGMSLTFDKRYITLAPVATVVGLAFQLKDPDGLLGDQPNLGISLALIPRDTKGMEIGKRHFPLNVPFQNGPVRGKDVFVPLDYLIGGPEMAGEGWRMLVEVLSIGRSISLPSMNAGGCKAGAFSTGAYARMRKQFNMPIGRFEGVEEALARIGGYTYAISALARMTAAAVDRGELPAVPSAIAKYWATEHGRRVASDTMDVLGGKGISLGPRNFAGRAWQGAPISITVEGANIMTRSLMIFGQGAVRSHPFVLKEMAALTESDPKKALIEFDDALFGHLGMAISNASRAFLMGLSGGLFARTPGKGRTRRNYRAIARYSAALGLVTDLSLLTLGGKLKFKEKLSARLGDVLSQLYIISAILKRFEDQDQPQADLPLLAWACQDAIYRMEEALDQFLRNFPMRPVAWLMRALVFPIGRWNSPPSDRMGHKVAALLLSPSETRGRLTEGVYKTDEPGNPIGIINATLASVIRAEPIERKLLKAIRSGKIAAQDRQQQLDEAIKIKLINKADRELIDKTRAAVAEIIAVDEFDSEELVAGVQTTEDQKPQAVA
jgi:acyl-CoA dehydrogenase